MFVLKAFNTRTLASVSTCLNYRNFLTVYTINVIPGILRIKRLCIDMQHFMSVVSLCRISAQNWYEKLLFSANSFWNKDWWCQSYSDVTSDIALVQFKKFSLKIKKQSFESASEVISKLKFDIYVTVFHIRVCRQMLLYSQEESGDCASSEEDLFIL